MASRYVRQEILPELGTDGQQRLKESSVLLVGVGGLGCPILQYLAAAGVGSITLIDDDPVCESNLQRQVLYLTCHIGKPKVEAAKQYIEEFNPEVKVTAICDRFSVSNAGNLVKEVDLVIAASDNFATTYLVNDVCVEFNKPFVFGSVLRFEGQVSVFNLQDRNEVPATYRCLFPEPPMMAEAPSCEDAGVIGSLVGVVGSLMASEAIKYLANFGELLHSKLFVLDMLSSNSKTLSFKGDPDNQCISIKTQDYYSKFNLCGSDMEITYDELKKLLSEDSVTLVDVREDFEREAGHIGGDHIPLQSLLENPPEFSTEKPVVFYCRSGKRSLYAAAMLQKDTTRSWPKMYSLAEGVEGID